LKTVVTLGEVMVRFNPPGFRRLYQSLPGTLEASFGGAEANVAVAIALLGGSSKFVTALPANPIGDACIAFLRGLNVDTSAIVRTRTGRIGCYYVENGANQRGGSVVYDRGESAAALTRWGDYQLDHAFSGASWFHISGITPALSSIAADVALQSVREAKRRGMTVSLDLNFRKKLWNWEAGVGPSELARKTVTPMIPFVDVLLGNEEDADNVLGIRSPGTDVDAGKITADRYPEVARRICADFPNLKYVAITLRESLSASHNKWGAMLYDSKLDKACFAPTRDRLYTPYEIHSIVDRVGAGDSFAGSLIYALTSSELSVPEVSLAFATAASCLAHSVVGDASFLQRSEVEALMTGRSSGRVQR